MKLKYLLRRAKLFKTRSRRCSSCCMGMVMKKRRMYKRGGSIRSKVSSVGKYIYKHRNKIAAAAALGAAYGKYRGDINAGNLIRSQPLF